MTRTTPELAPPLQTSAPHQREDIWLHTYDLMCNRSIIPRIFIGIGSPTWSLLLRSRRFNSRPPQPQFSLKRYKKEGSRSSSGRVSASGQEGLKPENRFHQRSAVYVSLFFKSYVLRQTLSRWYGAEVWGGDVSSGVTSSFDIKMVRSVRK
ncbi:hypothetical protein AVEN_28350-1 [Araneus ventricosus]|uniref:Uncharacterized protein n=1 Tax=Araneus ventricosus TaxID=182803 RepID=A0A4Y2F7F0_ARAVE|nr:hypothetical protein AVEN_28350-1 [Araneus ventricosus]